jgi:hypothetical protein
MDPGVLKLILSAAVGALISGFVNHIYRRREAAIDRRKRERRAAFIYVAQLIRFKVTADVVVDVCRPFSAGMIAAIADFRKEHPTDATTEELICAHFYEALKQSPDVIEPLAYANLITMIESWNRNFAQMMNFRLDIDQLATLPKDVAIEYSIFENSTNQLGILLDSVVEWINTKRDPGVSQLFGAWLSLKTFFESNERLLVALREYAEITDDDYKKAFDAQNRAYRQMISTSIAAGPRLESILDAVRKEILKRGKS